MKSLLQEIVVPETYPFNPPKVRLSILCMFHVRVPHSRFCDILKGAISYKNLASEYFFSHGSHLPRHSQRPMASLQIRDFISTVLN